MDTEKIITNAKNYGVPIIRSESHKILEDIVKNASPINILEIGTAVGYSGIIMLKQSKHSKLTTIEHNQKYIAEARKNFRKAKLSKRVKILEGDCHVWLAKMVASKEYDGYYNFIFLDGPKAQYDLMLENLIFLLAPGGTLVADNVLFHGYVDGKNGESKRFKTITKRLENFIENVKTNNQLTNFKLISVEDGMIVVRKVKNENK